MDLHSTPSPVEGLLGDRRSSVRQRGAGVSAALGLWVGRGEEEEFGMRG